MSRRTDLQTLLQSVIGSGKKVYFQPPSTITMVYPCIVYQRNDTKTQYADNHPYHYEKEYIVTVIDSNPDSLIPDKVAALPKTRFDRAFTSENLNHDVFTIYF